MRRTFFTFIIFTLLVSCSKNEPCTFENNFLNDSLTEENYPNFTLYTEDCETYFLKSDFTYHFEDYIVDMKLKNIDSTFYNNKDIVFDFSRNRKSGVLRISDSLGIPINFITEIEDNLNGKYSLFQLSNIAEFYGVEINSILVISYNHGIVGEFGSGKENGLTYQFRYKGYKPNEKLIDSLFVKAKLL